MATNAAVPPSARTRSAASWHSRPVVGESTPPLNPSPQPRSPLSASCSPRNVTRRSTSAAASNSAGTMSSALMAACTDVRLARSTRLTIPGAKPDDRRRPTVPAISLGTSSPPAPYRSSSSAGISGPSKRFAAARRARTSSGFVLLEQPGRSRREAERDCRKQHRHADRVRPAGLGDGEEPEAADEAGGGEAPGAGGGGGGGAPGRGRRDPGARAATVAGLGAAAVGAVVAEAAGAGEPQQRE